MNLNQRGTASSKKLSNINLNTTEAKGVPRQSFSFKKL